MKFYGIGPRGWNKGEATETTINANTEKLTVDFLEADRINALPMCCNKLDRKTLNQKLFWSFFYKIDDAISPKCAASSQCTKDVKGLAQYWWSQTTYLAEINPYSSQLAGLYILMVPSWLLVRLVPELSSAISMDSDLSGPDIENWEL